MRELILFICKSLVDLPDSVKVNEINSCGSVIVYEIFVDKTDVGKIIGKQGITARALRTIVNAVASKLKKRVVIEIIE
jgi:hypothetical protein